MDAGSVVKSSFGKLLSHIPHSIPTTPSRTKKKHKNAVDSVSTSKQGDLPKIPATDTKQCNNSQQPPQLSTSNTSTNPPLHIPSNQLHPQSAAHPRGPPLNRRRSSGIDLGDRWNPEESCFANSTGGGLLHQARLVKSSSCQTIGPPEDEVEDGLLCGKFSNNVKQIPLILLTFLGYICDSDSTVYFLCYISALCCNYI